MCVLLFLVLSITSWAQEAIPIGSWRTHFSYQNAHTFAIAGQKIYTAAVNGFFYYDQEDKSINVLSKLDGLHENGIATLAYHPQQQALLVAYRSGGIDVLTETRISAYNLLKDAATAQTEQIHHITFVNDTVFMATSVGVRVFLLNAGTKEPLRILESYTRLSDDGAADLPVYETTVFHDSLFIATEEGILAASLNPAINRQDFENWRRFGAAEGMATTGVRHLAVADNQLFATADTDGLYRYENGYWLPASFVTSGNFASLSAAAKGLLVVADNKIFTYQGEATEIVSTLAKNPVFARFDAAGALWVADSAHGLVKIKGALEESFFPSGPPTDNTEYIYFAKDKIFGMAGGYTSAYLPAGSSTGLYSFAKGSWKNHSAETQAVPVGDLVDVAYNPANQQFYFASFGDGIGVWDGEKNITLIDENSPESTLINSSPPDRFTRISALEIEEEEQLWIANYGVNTPLHSWNLQNNNWKAYSFSKDEARFPLDVLVAISGDKWLLLKNGNILVFNDETGEERYLGNTTGEGGLPGTKATTIISDKDGLIWAGTDQGVAFFPDPFSVFSGNVDAVRPIFDRRPLLRDQLITAIAVDGGNRKWIGTPNGLWLFDEAGETLVHNFTTENSPLPSNYIKDIAIDANSGEVFIATTQGMVSYRGTATKGGTENQAVKIFPNPVSMSFNGEVGISGLVDDAIVKITTVTGTLVREVKAAGGMATWNVTDYRNERVATGVYLVFSASSNGSETFVGKIAVVN